jgi:hypothetical protein
MADGAQPDLAEIDRAWSYHHAADELLHSRVESLLIAHAFLAAAYAQVISGSSEKPHTGFFSGMVIVLALVVTPMLMTTTFGLLKGTLHLKRRLICDEVYKDYLSAVAHDYQKRKFRPAILPVLVPIVLLGFWFVVGVDRLFGGQFAIAIRGFVEGIMR